MISPTHAIRCSVRSLPWVLLALLTVGAVSHAAPGQDDFHRFLHAAVQLFQDGDNERALEQLRLARRVAQGVEQHAAVALHEGIFLADMGGKWEESRAAFKTALLLNPEATLPFKVAPKVERSFQQVRAAQRGRAPQAPAPERPEALEEPARPEALAGAGPSDVRGEMTPAPVPPAARQEPQPVVAQTDRPERSPSPDLGAPVGAGPERLLASKAPRARVRVPVVPIALAGAGVVAAGMGAWFGMQSRAPVDEVRSAYKNGLPPQSDLPRLIGLLEKSRGQARTANALFGVAGVAVTGAIVTWVLMSGDSGSAREEAH